MEARAVWRCSRDLTVQEERKFMNKLLFVDDEPRILKSLERMLMDTDYDLYTASSGDQALAILQEAGLT